MAWGDVLISYASSPVRLLSRKWMWDNFWSSINFIDVVLKLVLMLNKSTKWTKIVIWSCWFDQKNWLQVIIVYRTLTPNKIDSISNANDVLSILISKSILTQTCNQHWFFWEIGRYMHHPSVINHYTPVVEMEVHRGRNDMFRFGVFHFCDAIYLKSLFGCKWREDISWKT